MTTPPSSSEQPNESTTKKNTAIPSVDWELEVFREIPGFDLLKLKPDRHAKEMSAIAKIRGELGTNPDELRKFLISFFRIYERPGAPTVRSPHELWMKRDKVLAHLLKYSAEVERYWYNHRTVAIEKKFAFNSHKGPENLCIQRPTPSATLGSSSTF